MILPHIDDPELPEKLATDYDDTFQKFDEKIFFQKRKTTKKRQLAPHQDFVRQFLNLHTDFDSLLLYHGLGTGKTTSSVFCCDTFLKNKCNVHIICPEAVKPAFIKEISETYNKVNNEQYVSFYNYDEFADEFSYFNEYSLQSVRATKFQFDHSLIIIDECHNLYKHSKLKSLLESKTFKKADYKLLLMSATPIYKSVDEIVWLMNLLNSRNEKRPYITSFDKSLLNGIVSYVKGDNPFTFPLKIFGQSVSFTGKFSTDLLYVSKSNNKLKTIVDIVKESKEEEEDILILVYVEDMNHREYLERELKQRCIFLDRSHAEGVDYKEVRQIHIVDPCETYTLMQQVIGRGCRSYSHAKLPPEKQNVQIFLHANESDVKKYNRLFKEYQPIAETLRELQENAVDSVLNEDQIVDDYNLEKETIELSWPRKKKLNVDFETYFKIINKYQ
jgi:superfamily II DNA or RNA helicase